MDVQLAANMLGLLLDGLQGSTPGFAHMLLGFDLQRGPSGGPAASLNPVHLLACTCCCTNFCWWLMCTLAWLRTCWACTNFCSSGCCEDLLAIYGFKALLCLLLICSSAGLKWCASIMCCVRLRASAASAYLSAFIKEQTELRCCSGSIGLYADLASDTASLTYYELLQAWQKGP